MRRVFIVTAISLVTVANAWAQGWPEVIATDQVPQRVYGAPTNVVTDAGPDSMVVIPPAGYTEPLVAYQDPVCEPQWCESPYQNSAWRIELDLIPTASHVSDQAFGDWENNGGLGLRLLLGYESCDGVGMRMALWGFGQEVYTPVGQVDLGASTFNIDLYKRFFVKDAELLVGGGSVGGHLEYKLDALNQSADFSGGGVSVFGEGYYPFLRFERTDIGQVVRARFSLLSGRWDDNNSPFISDTGHDTMSILDIGWGLELRRRFGKAQDKYWYLAIVPQFQRWESASLPNAFDPSFQGTSFNFGLAW